MQQVLASMTCCAGQFGGAGKCSYYVYLVQENDILAFQLRVNFHFIFHVGDFLVFPAPLDNWCLTHWGFHLTLLSL